MFELLIFGGGGVDVSPVGEIEYTAPATYTFTVPPGVSSVSCLIIGAGAQCAAPLGAYSVRGGRSGSIRYRNNIPVTPGEKYTIKVGSGGTRVQASVASYYRNAQSTTDAQTTAFGMMASYSADVSVTSELSDTVFGVDCLVEPIANGSASGQSLGADTSTFTEGATTVNLKAIGRDLAGNPTVREIPMSGGNCGAGGSGVSPSTSSGYKAVGAGGHGGVKIIWGDGREFPSA